MKVLHLLSSNQFSGAENVAIQIIKLSQPIESVYCSPKGDIKSKLQSENVEHFLIEKMSLKEVKRAIGAVKPDIIHAHDAMASVLAGASGSGLPIVSHIHGNHENMRKITAKSFLFNLFKGKFKKIFWVSQSAMDGYIFKDKVKEKSEVLVNVIDASFMNSEISFVYDLIFLGRLNDIKDPLRALKIIHELIIEKPDYKAVFVGEGDLMDACVEYVKAQGLSDNIEFKGFLKNPISVLAQSSVLFMTSVYEGTPMAALEAMSLGKAIVSTPTDGMVNLVVDGVTGFLSDDDRILKEKLLFLTNKEELDHMTPQVLKQFSVVNDTALYSKKIKETYRLLSK